MTSRTEVTASYTSPRHDVVALVPRSARRILELGCSNGSTARILRLRQQCTYTGIERDEALAVQARDAIDDVVVLDLDDPAWSDRLIGTFDCVITADVLEHLLDPWRVLVQVVKVLDPGGSVVLSIPNARHVQTIVNLLRGRWPYRERGVHDATHLRFFTLREVRALCGVAGLRIERLERNRRLFDQGGPWDRVTRLAPFLGLGELLTYQYVLRATVSTPSETIADESTPPWHRSTPSRRGDGDVR